MLHLIGLAHRAQSRNPDREHTDSQQTFERILRRLIVDVRPLLIAEEDSEEALAERREASIARAIAIENHIEHRFCDPNHEQRSAIGYRDGQSLEVEIFMRDQEVLPNEEIRLKGRAIEIGRYFPIRERFWLERLAGSLDREPIFICGDGHIETFGKVLEGNGISYRIAARGIGLIDDDRSFDDAVRYLKEHPELRG